ncbi:hypothetical protein SAMN04487939_102375 [Lysobacter sp. yr284]|uniref:hypothetical protein n=1 Tax=Lysobacter TaxID=68 RepID=UPI00089BF9DB|nr:hypothetical protein [Lysobacter sp. yr284]SDY48989.1 hypothetical protein SAMN04487939_102375 [Lysobacter sp. yr284]
MQVETNDYVELKHEILDGMRSYMEDLAQDGADAGYGAAEIDECERVIDAFLAALRNAVVDGERVPSPAQLDRTARAAVEQAVRALNTLNARCRYNLIETDQREGLCELVRSALAGIGALRGQDDPTEPWREW